MTKNVWQGIRTAATPQSRCDWVYGASHYSLTIRISNIFTRSYNLEMSRPSAIFPALPEQSKSDGEANERWEFG
jgi:hypothetical protein